MHPSGSPIGAQMGHIACPMFSTHVLTYCAPNQPEVQPRSKEKPRILRGLLSCAEEDSNLHGRILPQGPQPCASTNSATGAGGVASIATACFRRTPPLLCANTCSYRPTSTCSERSSADGPDEAPAGDLRLHQAVLGEVWLPADRARHRQGRRARVLVDGARAPREPGEARPAPAGSDEAARDRAARPRDGVGARPRSRPSGVAARRLGRGRSTDPGGGEHRGVRPRSVRRRRGGRGLRAARARRVDGRRRDPGGRLRRRPPAGRGRRRGHRRGARRRGGRGDREALLPRVRPRAAAAGERDDGADPLDATCASSARSSACSGACT